MPNLGRYSDPGLLILSSLAGGPKHGYAMMEDILDFSGTRLEPGTLYGALVVFICLVLIPVALIARVPLRDFWNAVKEPATIAFATTSSESALPKAMENMERLGVPRRIVGFVLPTGYSFNLDGTTLYLSLASIFVAQAAGVHLSISEQVFMMLTLMLTSKGVAGVPRASMVILLGTLASFHLPPEGVLVKRDVRSDMDNPQHKDLDTQVKAATATAAGGAGGAPAVAGAP